MEEEAIDLKLRAALYKKLLEVKRRVPSITNDKDGFNYSYASPEQVLGVLNPLLNEAGLFLKTEVIGEYHEKSFVKSKPVEVWSGSVAAGKTVKEFTMQDVFEVLYHLDLLFTWVDTETGYSESAHWRASGVNNEEQGVGSALTYAERYFLLKTFNIATGNADPDNRNQTKIEPVKKELVAKKQTAPKAVKPAEPKKDDSTPAPAKATEKTPEPEKPNTKADLTDDSGNLKPNPEALKEGEQSIVEAQKKAAKTFFNKYADKQWPVVQALAKEIDNEYYKYTTVDDLVENVPMAALKQLKANLLAKEDKKKSGAA